MNGGRPAGRHHPLGAGGRNRRAAPLLFPDAAGCTHEFLIWLVGQRLPYPVALTLPDGVAASLERSHPRAARRPTTLATRSATAPIRHQHRPRSARRRRTTSPPPGPAARTASATPMTPADQPAAARLHPGPDLVRHRRARRRTHCLDADAHLHRSRRAPLGTQRPAATAVLHRSSTRPARLATTPAPVRARTLGRAARQDHNPAGHPRSRLINANSFRQPQRTPARGTGEPGGPRTERHPQCKITHCALWQRRDHQRPQSCEGSGLAGYGISFSARIHANHAR
jgi:hypothetical protein